MTNGPQPSGTSLDASKSVAAVPGRRGLVDDGPDARLCRVADRSTLQVAKGLGLVETSAARVGPSHRATCGSSLRAWHGGLKAHAGGLRSRAEAD